MGLCGSKIETPLKKFIEIDPKYTELGRLDDGTGIAETLETRNAVYHKKCQDKICQKEYNRFLTRVGKKPCSEANSSSSAVISHKRTKTELGTELCIYVERETQQKIQHVHKLTESWSEMALAINDLDVHAKLCGANVRSNEIFYHKNYLS